MRRLIFLIFICFVTCKIAFASDCNSDCNSKCSGGDAFKYIKKDDNSDYKVCNYSTYFNLQFPNKTIGWGKNCAIPAGEHDPLQYSCIAAGSVFGEVLDTLTTVGIAIAMRENFCSFSAGDHKLEGAVIDKAIITKKCGGASANQSATCIKCLFRGMTFNASTGDCNPPCDSSDYNCDTKLDLDSFISSTDDGDTPYLCNGIPNLERPLLDDSGTQVYDQYGYPVYCPIMRCNIPSNDIIAKYYDDVNSRTAIMAAFAGGIGGVVSEIYGSCCDVKDLYPGNEKGVALWQIVRLKGSAQGDRTCVKMYFGIDGWSTMACKPAVAEKPTFPATACFIRNTPIAGVGIKSQWITPITSMFIQTATMTFDSLFTGDYGEGEVCQTGLTDFQDNMRDITTLCLILYVVIVGYKLMYGALPLNKRTLFVVIGNFVLVTYFCLDMPGQDNNGLLWLRDITQSFTQTFSDLMSEASAGINSTDSSSALCDFGDPTIPSYDSGFSYLKTWDILDCKILSYLSLASPTYDSFSAMQNGTHFMLNVSHTVFNMMWSLFFSGNLLILVFLFALWIFLVSLIVYFANYYIVALISVIIMIFFGPIFVPMALFKPTKQYFDAWLRTIIAYTIQPVVVVAIIGFFLGTFDSVIFSGCTFEKTTFSDGKPYWTFKDCEGKEDQEDCKNWKYCKESYGYIISNLVGNKYLKTNNVNGDTDKMMYTYNTTDHKLLEEMTTLLEGLMITTFMAFLFYYFMEQVDGFVSELTGAASVGAQAMSPNAITDAAIAVATRGKFAKAKQAIKKARAETGKDRKRGKKDGVGVSARNTLRSGDVSNSGSSSQSRGVDVNASGDKK
ncbi:MAG: type IV secretion system protein [Rickettsiales bacterium]|nr:type IV secretion system protein [Rickettsiales bacterium]